MPSFEAKVKNELPNNIRYMEPEKAADALYDLLSDLAVVRNVTTKQQTNELSNGKVVDARWIEARFRPDVDGKTIVNWIAEEMADDQIEVNRLDSNAFTLNFLYKSGPAEYVNPVDDQHMDE